LRDGRLQQLGTPDEIYRYPANRFVAGFVGSPGMNFVLGRTEAEAVRLPDLLLTLPGERREQWKAFRAAGEKTVLVGIRPENIEVGVRDGAVGDVYAVEPLGSDVLVVFTWADARLTARTPASFRARPGERLRFRFAPESALLFDPATGKRLPVDPL
ncbi:MAG: TOBE domain-containing protein, partial [Acidobacteriota bacterium]